MFGNWFNDDSLSFVNEEHIVIEEFFDTENSEKICIPDPDETWVHYDNPIEQKYTMNDMSKLPYNIKNVFDVFQSDEFVNKLKKMSGIHDLEKDDILHGAGIHAYPRNGKLDIHLDYDINPISKKQRRLNLIVYMSKDWKEEYGGDLELRGKTIKASTGFNTAIIFRTNDTAFHGVPKPIQCPYGMFRKSMNVYYYLMNLYLLNNVVFIVVY
jgi:Rps23 Pro-64 3,4-dihydroxylase Tpa1-like proline 4-hydroxylase